jgi:hypothetical protein
MVMNPRHRMVREWSDDLPRGPAKWIAGLSIPQSGYALAGIRSEAIDGYGRRAPSVAEAVNSNFKSNAIAHR